MITKFTILGERCTGTNFLELAIQKNFDIALTWEYGWKHFFGYNDYENSDDTLFIAIVRNPHAWMNSLYRTPHHLQPKMLENSTTFLNEKFWSYFNNIAHVGAGHEKLIGQEIKQDRHIYTQEQYKNIFEAREIKCKFLVDDMKSKVKNYILIRYEDLKDHYIATLDKIKNEFSLKQIPSEYIFIDMIVPESIYPQSSRIELLDRKIINDKLNWEIESQMGYFRK